MYRAIDALGLARDCPSFRVSQPGTRKTSMKGFAYPFSIAGFADGAPLDSIASGPPRPPAPHPAPQLTAQAQPVAAMPARFLSGNLTNAR